MAKAETKTELVCPICRLLSEMFECVSGKTEFMTHFNKARIEFLEGLKSLIDLRIESLRKRAPGEKRTTKIEVS